MADYVFVYGTLKPELVPPEIAAAFFRRRHGACSTF